MDIIIEEIITEIIKELGYGFNEVIYHNAFLTELRLRNINYQTETIIPITYKNHNVGSVRSDIIIDNKYVIELKSTSKIINSNRTQLSNYLKFLNLTDGYLINFQPENYEVIKINI